MSKPRSKLIDYNSRVFRDVRGFTTEIHFGKQEKHLPSNRAYNPTRSPLSIGVLEVQQLIEQHAGTGRWEGANKEVVEFGIEIGNYRDGRSGTLKPTSRGTIHYSKTGAHLVPARPRRPFGKRI